MTDPTPEAQEYGELSAEDYDWCWEHVWPYDQIADFLAELHTGGSLLELGVGTGLVALRLVERGVQVEGVDASQAMLDQLAAKPGGEKIKTYLHDFTQPLPESRQRYNTVAVPIGTLALITDQDQQLRVFESVAEMLAPGGHFVIEMPAQGAVTVPLRLDGPDAIWLMTATSPECPQTVIGSHILYRHGRVRQWPLRLRFIRAPEMDLMARHAGLEKVARYADWQRNQYNSGTPAFVSVYRKASA